MRIHKDSPHFSRRRLLTTLGASSALAPFLPILNASGLELNFPKRLLLFYSPDGTASIDHGGAIVDWSPTGGETDFTLHYIHEPLEPFKNKLVFPLGMRFSAGGAGQEHAFGMSGLWSGASLKPPGAGADFDGGNGQRTGWGSGPSIDQVIARGSGPDAPYATGPDDGQETPYRTLELGVQCQDPHSMHRMIYAGDDQPIHPEVNPRAAFDRLFAGITDAPATETPSGDAATPDPRKRAAVDLLLTQTERLRSRVGREEAFKIDAHLDGLSAIQRRLDQAIAPVEGCVAPTGEMPEPRSQWENSQSFPAEATAMMDIVAHSLACDLTRVASLQLSRGFSNIVHDWVGVSQGHHTVSHLDGDHREELQEIDRWYATQFAYLLAKLDSIPEGDGTLLDNTLVVWGREMATTSHKMTPIHIVMAGGARGALATGRALRFDREPHAKALVSIARLMGLDIASVGDRDPDSGPLDGIG